jgi:hypothetical protein
VAVQQSVTGMTARVAVGMSASAWSAGWQVGARNGAWRRGPPGEAPRTPAGVLEVLPRPVIFQKLRHLGRLHRPGFEGILSRLLTECFWQTNRQLSQCRDTIGKMPHPKIDQQ